MPSLKAQTVALITLAERAFLREEYDLYRQRVKLAYEYAEEFLPTTDLTWHELCREVEKYNGSR